MGYARVPLRCTVRVRPVGSVQVAVTVTTPAPWTSAEALETYVPLASVSGVAPKASDAALRVRVIGGRVEGVDAGGLGFRAVEGLDVQGVAPRQTGFDRAHLEERDAEQGHDHHDRETHEERRPPLVAERGLREAASPRLVSSSAVPPAARQADAERHDIHAVEVAVAIADREGQTDLGHGGPGHRRGPS